MIHVSFRRHASSVADDVSHVSYVRVGAAGSGATCPEGLRSGESGECVPASSGYASTQMAAYYVRTAELLSFVGKEKAQDVVEQVNPTHDSLDGCLLEEQVC